MENKRPNMRLLPNGRYLVRTQAGFKKASRHWVSKHNHDSGGATPKILGFPRSYPSVVYFEFDHVRTQSICAHCTHIKKFAANLRHLLQCLEPDLIPGGKENASSSDDCSSSV